MEIDDETAYQRAKGNSTILSTVMDVTKIVRRIKKPEYERFLAGIVNCVST